MSITTLQFLENYIAQNASAELKKYMKGLEFTVTDVSEEDQLAIYSKRMSILILWSHIGSVTLKFHFKLETAKLLVSKTLNKSIDTITDDSAHDFMRELNNMLGGAVRGGLGKQSILVGMSLPFLADGSDEMVFRQILDPRANCRAWTISHGDEYEIFFTTETCLLDPKPLEMVRETLQSELEAKSNITDLGDVDFL